MCALVGAYPCAPYILFTFCSSPVHLLARPRSPQVGTVEALPPPRRRAPTSQRLSYDCQVTVPQHPTPRSNSYELDRHLRKNPVETCGYVDNRKDTHEPTHPRMQTMGHPTTPPSSRHQRLHMLGHRRHTPGVRHPRAIRRTRPPVRIHPHQRHLVHITPPPRHQLRALPTSPSPSTSP